MLSHDTLSYQPLSSIASGPDAPPFSRSWLPLVLATWAVTLVPLWTVVGVPVAPPDSPPFGKRAWLKTALDSWSPDPVIVWQNGSLDQPQDDPPAGRRRWLDSVIDSWGPEAPRNQQRRLLAQSGAAAQVDNPPFAQRRSPAALAWDQPWWNAQTRDPQLVLVNDDPPFGAKPNPAIRRAWEPEPWAAQFRELLPQPAAVTINDPPFGSKSWLAVRQAWEPEFPRQPARVLQVPPTPDNPPFGQKPWINGLVASWVQEPPFVGDPLARFVQVAAAAVDNPPFGLRSWLPSVRETWAPAAYTPQVLTHLAQPGAAQAVDQPVGDPWLFGVVAAWTQEWPAAQARRLVVQPLAADNPPFGARPWIHGIVGAWQPVPPERVIIRHVTRGLDNPPFGLKTWYWSVRDSWEPGPPPRQKFELVRSEAGQTFQAAWAKGANTIMGPGRTS